MFCEVMESENFEYVLNLEQQLDNAKQSLIILNDNIRRFAGRNSKDSRNDKPFVERVRQTHKGEKNKHHSYDSKSTFNRLPASTPRSSITEAELKPRVNSSVIREMPTKEEIVEAQGTDSESRARNRRMFGSLIGTLHKFCQEESRLKQKEDKKAQIERKLEEQELLERESLKKERETLFIDRKRKQLEIKTLEIKMRRLKDFQTWEASMLHYKNYIQTKTKPQICFRPRLISSHTKQLLETSKTSVKKMIAIKREEMQNNLEETESSIDLESDFHTNKPHKSESQINKQEPKCTTLLMKSKLRGGVIEDFPSMRNDTKDGRESKENNLQKPTLLNAK